jgi:hypothetical protein
MKIIAPKLMRCCNLTPLKSGRLDIQHFVPLVEYYFEQGLPHAGVIVARQFDKGTLLRRTLALLASLISESLANTLRFV